MLPDRHGVSEHLILLIDCTEYRGIRVLKHRLQLVRSVFHRIRNKKIRPFFGMNIQNLHQQLPDRRNPIAGISFSSAMRIFMKKPPFR